MTLGLFVALVASLSLGASLRCYQCNSKQEPECSEPASANANLSTVDCEAAGKTLEALETVANLMTRLGQAPPRDSSDPMGAARPSSAALSTTSCQKIEFDVGGERVTGRGCSVEVGGVAPCDAVRLVAGDAAVLFCEVCAEDGCNAAASPKLASLAAAAAAWPLLGGRPLVT